MRKPLQRHSLGLYAEWLCRLFLRIKGYQILQSRLRTPLGEIDIIARKGNTLVIVEVKARASISNGLQAVTEHQRKRIVAAAQWFMAGYNNATPHNSRGWWRSMRNNRSHARGFETVRFDLMVVTPSLLPKHLINAWE